MTKPTHVDEKELREIATDFLNPRAAIGPLTKTLARATLQLLDERAALMAERDTLKTTLAARDETVRELDAQVERLRQKRDDAYSEAAELVNKLESSK